MRYRSSYIFILLSLLALPLLAVDGTEPAVSQEGFKMTGMARETLVKETAAMSFMGMGRPTATRVFKETTEKNN